MQDIYAFVGQRIRAERKGRKLTLEELASAAGMNTSFLQQIESAKKKPSLNTLNRLADALGIPVHKFLEGAAAAKKADPYVGKLALMVRDADERRRRAILRVVKEITRPGRSGR